MVRVGFWRGEDELVDQQSELFGEVEEEGRIGNVIELLGGREKL